VSEYDASSAYIKSQAHAGWTIIRSRYDDGGYSGGSTDRPDLQRLLDDVRGRKLDVIVVYKVDRLTRSLADFAKLVELFDAHLSSPLCTFALKLGRRKPQAKLKPKENPAAARVQQYAPPIKLR
jgi:Resolvase, N terminal domain